MSSNPFELLGRDGEARLGRLHLTHGDVETPSFMPVGTQATVKGLTPAELIELGAEMVLANTYHLWLRPGRATIEGAGGLHAFMGWQRPILTDSGGFQVFSLESRRVLDDDGVCFRSHLDGSEHRFTPENVVAFQEALGVDVAMALDVCVKLPAPIAEIDAAVARTTQWAARCAAARTSPRTLLFGIVQGGLDRAARTRSAAALVALDLPGYAIGGLSVGETRAEVLRYRTLHRLAPSGRSAALSHGCGNDSRSDRGDRRRGRHVRLRLPDALRSQRSRDDAIGRIRRSQRRLHERPASNRSDVLVRGLRALHARVRRASLQSR